MRLLLISAWFAFIATASFWLPAYKGDIGGDEGTYAVIYGAIAVVTAVGVRKRADSPRAAARSALPILGLFLLGALAGVVDSQSQDDVRGEPIYLWFGVALLASWTVLVLATALLARTNWTRPLAIIIGCVVTLLGLFFFTAQID